MKLVKEMIRGKTETVASRVTAMKAIIAASQPHTGTAGMNYFKHSWLARLSTSSLDELDPHAFTEPSSANAPAARDPQDVGARIITAMAQ